MVRTMPMMTAVLRTEVQARKISGWKNISRFGINAKSGECRRPDRVNVSDGLSSTLNEAAASQI
jgi:hypothetical protein